MAHITDWARENKMAINLLKTMELAFRRHNVSGDLLPPALSDVKRVCDAKLLGVCFRHDLNFFKHIDSVVATCHVIRDFICWDSLQSWALVYMPCTLF